MQRRKIDDSKIWEAYHRLMSGESLTKVAAAEDINLDRGTLRKYIELVVVPTLEQAQKSELKQLMIKNFRGNSTQQARPHRNGKRRKAEEAISQSPEMKALVDLGVTPQHIEDLYQRLKLDKRTTVSRDTYILKCLEHLTALRKIGFTTEDAFSFFMRRPKLFAGDASKIIGTFNGLVQKYGSTGIALQKLTEDPWSDLRENDSSAQKGRDED